MKSTVRDTVPAVICGIPFFLTFSVVPSDTLGLLIGRDFIEPSDIIIHLKKRELRLGENKTLLHDSYAGHPAIDLQPDQWRDLRNSLEYQNQDLTSDLPFALRPRKRNGPPKPQQILPHPKRSKPFVGRAVMALSTLAAAVQGVTTVGTTRILRGGGGKTGVQRNLEH